MELYMKASSDSFLFFNIPSVKDGYKSTKISSKNILSKCH
jgi:hypothetical protein